MEILTGLSGVKAIKKGTAGDRALELVCTLTIDWVETGVLQQDKIEQLRVAIAKRAGAMIDHDGRALLGMERMCVSLDAEMDVPEDRRSIHSVARDMFANSKSIFRGDRVAKGYLHVARLISSVRETDMAEAIRLSNTDIRTRDPLVRSLRIVNKEWIRRIKLTDL